MTDQPAHQILYDLQYARGGDGDERKFVNVTDIAGSHADALLAQIQRDQAERDQLQRRQQEQYQQPTMAPPSIPMIGHTTTAPSSGYPLGFERQNAQAMYEHPQYPSTVAYPTKLGFNPPSDPISVHPSDVPRVDEQRWQNDLIVERRRQREQEEREAERLAFGRVDDERSQRRVTYEDDERVRALASAHRSLSLARSARMCLSSFSSDSHAQPSRPPTPLRASSIRSRCVRSRLARLASKPSATGRSPSKPPPLVTHSRRARPPVTRRYIPRPPLHEKPHRLPLPTDIARLVSASNRSWRASASRTRCISPMPLCTVSPYPERKR